MSSFFEPLSFRPIATDEERERYRDAATGLFSAAVLAFVLTAIAVNFLPEVETGPVWAGAQKRWSVLSIAIVAWILGCIVPHYRREKLRHVEGSVSVVAAFWAVSFLLYFVVRATGSLYESAFSATFFVVLSVGFWLPQSPAIRVAFVTIVLVEAIFLIGTDIGHERHDAVMVGLSLITNFFVIIVRHFLDKVSGKESPRASDH